MKVKTFFTLLFVLKRSFCPKIRKYFFPTQHGISELKLQSFDSDIQSLWILSFDYQKPHQTVKNDYFRKKSSRTATFHDDYTIHAKNVRSFLNPRIMFFRHCFTKIMISIIIVIMKLWIIHICSWFIDTVPHKIDFAAYGLHRDHSPAWESNCQEP